MFFQHVVVKVILSLLAWLSAGVIGIMIVCMSVNPQPLIIPADLNNLTERQVLLLAEYREKHRTRISAVKTGILKQEGKADVIVYKDTLGDRLEFDGGSPYIPFNGYGNPDYIDDRFLDDIGTYQPSGWFFWMPNQMTKEEYEQNGRKFIISAILAGIYVILFQILSLSWIPVGRQD